LGQALALGVAIGAGSESGAALLLYTSKGFLGTAGFLVGLVLIALALGLWVGADERPVRGRWLATVVAFAAAGAFAWLWYGQPGFRKSAVAGALAALLLLAGPAYTAGAAYQSLPRRSTEAGAVAFFGAAFGVVGASLFFIPRSHPSVIFLVAAVVLLLIKPRNTPGEGIA
jgi:hypothetical protein